MPRLIDADFVCEQIEKEKKDIVIPDHYSKCKNSEYDIGYNNALTMAKSIAMKAPTIEAEPVRHGYWDDSGKYTYPDGSIAIQCSECGCDLEEHEYKEYWWHYCPVCGAKMDGKVE